MKTVTIVMSQPLIPAIKSDRTDPGELFFEFVGMKKVLFRTHVDPAQAEISETFVFTG